MNASLAASAAKATLLLSALALAAVAPGVARPAMAETVQIGRAHV